MAKIADMQEVRIELLKPYERNAKIHGEDQILKLMDSIREFGFLSPCLVERDTYNLIAGHGRVEAAKRLGMKAVPCVFVEDITEAQRKAYILADNRLTELGEWDMDMVNIELEELNDMGFDVSLTGFELDIDEPPVAEEDNYEEPEEIEPRTKLGDLWQLGQHRLMCGDSTDVNVIDRLMDGVKADMVFTDPPYGMKKESEGVLNDNLNYDDLLDFNRQWIPLTFGALKDNGSWYCWGIDEPLMDIYANILRPLQSERKIVFRNLITWDKGNGQGQLNSDFRMYPVADEKCLFVMNGTEGFYSFKEFKVEFHNELLKRFENAGITVEEAAKRFREYQNQDEQSDMLWSSILHLKYPSVFNFPKLEYWIAWFGSEEGWQDYKNRYEKAKQEWRETLAYFDNTHDNMNNVWHFDRAGKDEREHTGGHATPKPIALCSRAIKSSSRENETVLDVFGGSGSTLIACEQLNRKCFMCELDPHYCDVIIDRWEHLTGEKAVRLNG